LNGRRRRGLRLSDADLKSHMLGCSDRGNERRDEDHNQRWENGFACHKHLSENYPSVVHFDAILMSADLSLAELLALVEIVDEHVDRNFPGVDPPRLLREVQQKLDAIVIQHRKEIGSPVGKAAKRAKAARK
jgi:hypothetical protein